MAIKSCRCCMVQVDRADHTDVVALVVQLFCNGFIFHRHGLIHVDGAGIGLVAGGKGGRSGGRVRAEGGGVIGHCRTRYREIHKVQRLVSIEDVVVILIGYCAQIVGCCLKLWVAHTVSDEHENIFGFFAGCCRSGCGNLSFVADCIGKSFLRSCCGNTADEQGACQGSCQNFRKYLFDLHGTLSFVILSSLLVHLLFYRFRVKTALALSLISG